MSDTPSLNPRVRSIIDDFNSMFTPGVKGEHVIKFLMKKYNITFYEIRKLFKQELKVDIGSKTVFYKKMHKYNEKQINEQSKHGIYCEIINGEEKISCPSTKNLQ